jgi:hypothetical protein
LNLHPWDEILAHADRKIQEGWNVYQQWNCAGCGVKQTMPDKNKFYLKGRCEECGRETDIKKDGMNFMAISWNAPEAS